MTTLEGVGMTTLDERAQRGAEIRARFGGGTPSSGSVPGSREMAPDLHRIADEALFGSIWQRPGLKIEYREMIVLSVLTVLQRENQLRRHVANAVNLGLTPQQVIEVMIHVSFYGGVPAAFTSMGVAQEVFKAKNIPFSPGQKHPVFPTVGIRPQRDPRRSLPTGSQAASGVNGRSDRNAKAGAGYSSGTGIHPIDHRVLLGVCMDPARLGPAEPFDLHPGRSNRVR